MHNLEVSATTPYILDQCLALFDQNHERPSLEPSLSAPVTPLSKYSSHPDIQFFSSIKRKHHFEYHKQKNQMNCDPLNRNSNLTSTGGFDPYSRALLLERLSTYNALNWNIPPSRDLNRTSETPAAPVFLEPLIFQETLATLALTLNELFCASNGWTCEPISRHNNFTNHLKCSACGAQLILRFNSVDEESYGQFLFDMEDIARLNDNMKTSYLSEIKQGAHSSSCPWKTLMCSLRGTYYLTPYIGATNSVLIAEYLDTLKNLIDNLPVLESMASFCQKLIPPPSTEIDEVFVRVSKMWFLDRFYSETKENFAAVLDFACPQWVYKVAAMGWNLSLQPYADTSVLIMACRSCNQRLFVEQEQNLNGDLSGLLFHKTWCSRSVPMGSSSFFEYSQKMIILLECLIGPHGEYLVDKESTFDMDSVTASRKRRESLDINEGLDRFTKLRKMYFVN